MRHSPCCKYDIIVLKRYGGQVSLPYCKKCGRRVWGMRSRVTRQEMYRRNGENLHRMYKKHKKSEKLMDVLTEVLIEKDAANF